MKKEVTAYDGTMVRGLDPVTLLSPYIMPRRTDSQVLVDLKLDLTNVEAFIRKHKEDIPGLTLYHIVFASIIRACATTPQINRFIARNRVFQRKDVRISMMVKKTLSVDSDEDTISPTFSTSESLAEIVQKINSEAEKALNAMGSDNNTGFDKLTSILEKVPAPLLKIFINFMMYLDRRGRLPKALVDMQPFHCGFFVTNVGSIGLPVICHHLYEFGTCSCFVGIGAKENVNELKRDGTLKSYRVLPLKVTLDSRICDGFTYSMALRTIKRCFAHPEILLEGYKE